jgi:hypothetical protein
LFAYQLADGFMFEAGPDIEYTDVQENEDRFIREPQAGVSDETFGRLLYGGLISRVVVDATDFSVNPRQGFRWETTASARAGISSSADAYATVESEGTLYVSPSLSPQVTFALHTGATHVFGEFPFFAAATLGSKHGLRGYRSTRFAGRTSIFQNIEARVELLQYAGSFGYGELGFLGFVDNGRVWTDNENSRRWHQGYGGGVWAYLFDSTVLTLTYGRSVEGGLITAKVGFDF